jgi:PHD/YefM family antitoxin component YafN of YafNO toxin-antitoxin module
MSDDSCFNFVNNAQLQSRCLELHESVCREKGRVEIRHGKAVCVLISKDELDSLEAALEILSNTSDVQKMARTIAALTHAVAQGPLMAPAETVQN